MQSINLMPGYRTAEYQLVLLPHQELRDRISTYKKEFATKYGLKDAYGGGTHLTLVKFSLLQMQEEKVVSRLQTIAMSYQPFKVELRNFGIYPTHSIFFNVETRLPIEKLVREIKAHRKILKTSTSEPHFLEDPNFTLARKLLPWQFESGWNEYRHKSFTGRFIADNMLLLKKKENEKKWQVVQRLEFMNLPVATKQGELF